MKAVLVASRGLWRGPAEHGCWQCSARYYGHRTFPHQQQAVGSKQKNIPRRTRLDHDREAKRDDVFMEQRQEEDQMEEGHRLYLLLV